MKTFKAIFTLAFLALTMTLSANTEPNEIGVKSKVVDEHSIVLQVFNLQQENTKVLLTNLEGTTTYLRKNIRNHNGYRLKIDLNDLVDGRYVLEVKQGEISKKQIILIRGNYPQLSSIAG